MTDFGIALNCVFGGVWGRVNCQFIRNRSKQKINKEGEGGKYGFAES